MTSYKVVHLVKQVSSTSMFWNDIIPNFKQVEHGRCYPTITAAPKYFFIKKKRELRSGYSANYYQCGLLSSVLLLRRMSKNQEGKLVIHVHTPVLVLVIFLLKLSGVKFKAVVTQHSTWKNFSRSIHRWSLWLLSFLVDKYVGCGNEVFDGMFIKTLKRLNKEDKLVVIPNGIPSTYLSSLANQRAQYIENKEEADGVNSIVVARMTPAKNCGALLELISKLPELGDIYWYGDGEQREQLEQEIKKLGLQDKLHLMGRVPRKAIYKALTKTDFYLTMSLWEGLSVADLEAVAVGCYPLMSNIPQRQAISEVSGIKLLPFDNSQKWRNEIQKYLDLKPTQRAQLGLEISEKICAEFSIEKMIKRYISVYKETF